MLNKRGILGIVLVLAVFIGLHFGFAPDHHQPRTTGTVMLGGVAFLLMTAAIFLATRLRFLEGAFGGLDRMYQVHKFCGIIAGFVILVHFFGVPKELPEGADPALNSLAPSGPLGMLAMIVLVLSLGLALNRNIPYNKWRMPHKLMGLVYFLTIGHFMTAPGAFFERFSASGYMLIGAAVIGVLSYLYSLFGMNKATGRRFKIEAVNAMERATEIVLSPLGEKIPFKSGQFAFVEVQGKGWSEPHPFTISSAPREDRLRFTLKVLGDWTRKVREELKPGGEVIVRGPYGCFDSTKGRQKQIWLAGGIGVTPFLSKIRDMDSDDDREVTLVYAVREEKEALFLEELDQHAAKLPNLKIVSLYSNKGEFARVDIMKTKIDGALSDYDFFLCGPKPMLKGLIKDLKAARVPSNSIHTEAFEFR